MSKKRWSILLALFTVFALIAAACGDDDTTVAEPEPAPAPAPAPADDGDDGDAMATVADVCPDPFIVQTDWFPEPEHAYTYNMIGTGGTVDAANGRYSGPLGDTFLSS